MFLAKNQVRQEMLNRVEVNEPLRYIGGPTTDSLLSSVSFVKRQCKEAVFAEAATNTKEFIQELEKGEELIGICGVKNAMEYILCIKFIVYKPKL